MGSAMHPANLVWNRAALEDGGAEPREGDRALASLLLIHGLVMNGGVQHAVETLSAAELTAGQRGFEFFGFHDVASLLSVAAAARDGDEDELDREYAKLIPTDGALTSRFKELFLMLPERFAPMSHQREAFTIRALPPTQRGPDGQRLGEIRIGDFHEKFELLLEDVTRVERDWLEQLENLLNGAPGVALRTGPNLIWALYRNGQDVTLQEQLLIADWEGTFDASGRVVSLPEWRATSEDGTPISQWRTSLAAIADFLRQARTPNPG